MKKKKKLLSDDLKNLENIEKVVTVIGRKLNFENFDRRITRPKLEEKVCHDLEDQGLVRMKMKIYEEGRSNEDQCKMTPGKISKKTTRKTNCITPQKIRSFGLGRGGGEVGINIIWIQCL